MAEIRLSYIMPLDFSEPIPEASSSDHPAQTTLKLRERLPGVYRDLRRSPEQRDVGARQPRGTDVHLHQLSVCKIIPEAQNYSLELFSE